MIKIKELKDYERIALALMFAIVILIIMILWNTYDIRKLDKRNKEFEERLTQLEVDYKIYEHDFIEEIE